ncbi:MAG: fibronectin type III domain-containing protein [Thermoguttaceae bacterium]
MGYTVTELLADTVYRYRVVAVNGNDDGYNESVNAVGWEFKMVETETEDL